MTTIVNIVYPILLQCWRSILSYVSRNDTTSIKVSAETWSALNGLKSPGDSFDDVIKRELDIEDDGAEIEA